MGWVIVLTCLCSLASLALVVRLSHYLFVEQRLALVQIAAQADETLVAVRAIQSAPAPAAEPEYWTGAFLPTDAAQAELEQRVRAAEDHAIQAGAPARFSPTASSASPGTARLRRAPRPSGSG